MAMLRSLGGSPLTTLSPMTTSPLLAFSSPAIVRIRVVLPEPEAPSSTRNSPSRTSRLTPSTALTAPKWVCRSRTVSFAIAGAPPLHGAGGARSRRRPRSRLPSDQAALAPRVVHGTGLGGGRPYRVLGRLVAAHRPGEHVRDHERVVDLRHRGAAHARVTDVRRPLDRVQQRPQLALGLALEPERVVLEPG